MNKISALIKHPRDLANSFYYYLRTKRKGTVYAPENKSSPDTECTGALLGPPRLQDGEKYISVVHKLPTLQYLSQKPEWTKTKIPEADGSRSPLCLFIR
jgi:hypothetical protein